MPLTRRLNPRARQMTTLANRRIDEILDLDKPKSLKFYVMDNKNKRAPEKIQKNWDASIHKFPEELIRIFTKIKGSAQPYTALGLEIDYVSRYDVDVGKQVTWSMYKMLRYMGYDFNVVNADMGQVLGAREQCPVIEHISPTFYNWFSRGSQYWEDGMLNFEKLARHMTKINNAIDDADIIAKRFVEEYGVVRDETWNASNYHLWRNIPKSTRTAKETLTALLDGEFD
jgi:hypothetical protein